jgi:hypothetical protein
MTSPISRATLWTSNFLLALSLSACATQDKTAGKVTGPIVQVYEATFEEVWRATQKTLAVYPIKINNADLAQLETEVIRPDKMWQPSHTNKGASSGTRYFLKVSAVKGVKGKDKEAIRLSLEKVITLERDFFAGAERVPSDGLEEESIFYRIQREITLERSLKAAYDQGKL